MPTGNPFLPASTGQKARLNRDWYNAVTAATQAQKRQRLGNAADPRGIFVPEGLIRVGNDSGADVPRFTVLGIEDIFYGPDDKLLEFQNRPAILGVVPTKASHTGQYVITYDPIPKNAIGRACIFGICVVKVNILTDGDDTADVADHDKTQLESGPIGSAQILWCESGTGSKWAVVRIGNGNLPPFPVTLSNPAGSFGTNGPPPTAPNLTYTVHHAKSGRFIADNVAVWPARQLGHVAAATKGYCDRINNITYIVQHDEVIDGGACA
jgi:hypothetical protein